MVAPHHATHKTLATILNATLQNIPVCSQNKYGFTALFIQKQEKQVTQYSVRLTQMTKLLYIQYLAWVGSIWCGLGLVWHLLYGLCVMSRSTTIPNLELLAGKNDSSTGILVGFGLLLFGLGYTIMQNPELLVATMINSWAL